MKRLLLGLLLLSFASAPALAQSDVNKIIIKNGNSLVKDKLIRSASIGVYFQGKVYTLHFGSLTEGLENPPNDNSIYEIASVTKTMVGILAAHAVLDAKIDLEAPVVNYLDGEYTNLQFEGQPVLIKHLLSHTAGLPHFLPEQLNGIYEKLTPEVPQEFEALEKGVTKADYFESLKQYQISQEPGTVFSYSNAGSELIGYILEQVYEIPLDDLLKQQLFTKAGMTDSAININKDQQLRAVKGYWMKNDTPSPYFANTLWAAGAGVKSTLADLMKYITFILESDDPAVKESQRELYHDGRTTWLGYNWRIWKDVYGTSYNHHGGSSGMQNWIYIFPDQDLGISILTNHSGPKTPAKLSKTVRKILKDLL